MKARAEPGIIKSTLFLAIASSICLVLGLLSTVLITHNFSTATFGTYTLVLVVALFLSTISSMGLDMTISRFIAAADDRTIKQTLINSAITARLCALLVGCLVCWIGKPLLILLFGPSLPSEILLFYVPLLFVLESMRILLKSILQGFFLFTRMGITEILMSSLNLVFLLALILFHKFGITELLVTRLIASGLASGFAFLSIPKVGKFSFQLSQLNKLMKFGFPLQMNDIFGFIFFRIDTLIIAALLGPTDIAIYEVGRRIPDSLRNLYEPLRSVYYPFLTKEYESGDHKKARKLLNDSTRLISFATILCSVIVLIFGEGIIRLLFSEKYLPSVHIFTLLMVSLSVALPANLLGISLVAVGCSDKPMIINLVKTPVSIVCNLVFIRFFGIMGAALTSIIGPLSTYPLTLIYLHKRLPVKTVSYLTSFLIFIVFAVLVYLFKPITYIGKAGYLIVFLLACALLSVITKNDIKLILEGSGISHWRPFEKLWASIRRT